MDYLDEEPFYPAIKLIIWLFLILVIIGLLFSFIPRQAVRYTVTNYEWFYDQYNTIKSMQQNVVNLSDKKSLSERQEIELQGMKMVLNNNISEYNAKAREITRALFKSDTLPYQIKLEE